jgi:hypothetical protein
MEVKLAPKWRCGKYRLVHDDEEDARDCCIPDTEGHACPHCGAFVQHEEEALVCCGYDRDGLPPPPMQAQLEAAGQRRLIP